MMIRELQKVKGYNSRRSYGLHWVGLILTLFEYTKKQAVTPCLPRYLCLLWLQLIHTPLLAPAWLCISVLLVKSISLNALTPQLIEASAPYLECLSCLGDMVFLGIKTCREEASPLPCIPYDVTITLFTWFWINKMIISQRYVRILSGPVAALRSELGTDQQDRYDL